MPASYVQQVGSAAVKASSATIGLPVAATTAAGSLITVKVGFDNLSLTTPTVTSISKPAGETASWARHASMDSPSGGSGAGVRGEVWAIKTTVAWATTDTITVTLSAAVTAKVGLMREYAGVDNVLRSTAVAGKSIDGSANVATAGTAPVAGDLVVGLLAGEAANTTHADDADTLAGPWSVGTTVNTAGGSGPTNIKLLTQYKIPNAGGHQEYNASLGANSDTVSAVLVFQQTPTAPPSNLTVALDTASLSLTAQDALGVVPPPLQTVALDSATLALGAQDAVALPGVVTRFVDTATVDLVAVGAVSTAGLLTVALDTASLALAAQDAARTSGTVAVPLDTAALALVGQDLSSVIATTITLDTATLALAAQDASATSGAPPAQAVTLDTAAVALVGQDASATSGAPPAQVATLDTAALALAAQDVTRTPGAATGTLDAATLALVGQDLSAGGGTTVLLDTAVLTVTAQDAEHTSGAVSRVLDGASVSLLAIEPTVQIGQASVELDTASLTLLAEDLFLPQALRPWLISLGPRALVAWRTARARVARMPRGAETAFAAAPARQAWDTGRARAAFSTGRATTEEPQP